MSGTTVRVGATARRPATGRTAFVQRLLGHLVATGAAWAPRPLGIDDEGREVITWIDGKVATSGADVDLQAMARVVRELHDLSTVLAGGAECVVHDDLQPRNVIVHGGEPVGLIDWEQARPGTRVEDVAGLCWSFTEPLPGRAPGQIVAVWRRIIDAYGPIDRSALLSTMTDRMERCAEDIASGAAAGSDRHVALHARGDHLAISAARAWVLANRGVLEAGLLDG